MGYVEWPPRRLWGRLRIGSLWMIVGKLAAVRRLGYVGMASALLGKQWRY